MFEQPEQPAPIEESESTYENASYVLVDDSEEELVDEEEILKELGCYVAETEEEANANKGTSTSSSASTSTSSASASTITTNNTYVNSSYGTTPTNPNDTVVADLGSDGIIWRSAETGRRYQIYRGKVVWFGVTQTHASGWK